MDLAQLRTVYDQTKPEIDRFRESFRDQISVLLEQASLSTAIPIESRTKTWSSIAAKIDRHLLNPQRPADLWDLVGIRVVFFSEAKSFVLVNC